MSSAKQEADWYDRATKNGKLINTDRINFADTNRLPPMDDDEARLVLARVVQRKEALLQLSAESPPDDEHRALLLQQVEEGNEAESQLVMANQRYVKFIRTAKFGSEYEAIYADLMQAGNLGLLFAIDHFDPSKNNTFSTYARVCIHCFMLDFLYGDKLITVPQSLAVLMRKISALTSLYYKKQGMNLSDDELAEQLDVDVEKIQRAKWFNKPVPSLDKEVDPRGDTLGESIIDEDAVVEAEYLQKEELWMLQYLLMTSLDHQEQELLDQLFGLSPDSAPQTSVSIAEKNSVSKTTIYNRRNTVLGKLWFRFRDADDISLYGEDSDVGFGIVNEQFLDDKRQISRAAEYFQKEFPKIIDEIPQYGFRLLLEQLFPEGEMKRYLDSKSHELYDPDSSIIFILKKIMSTTLTPRQREILTRLYHLETEIKYELIDVLARHLNMSPLTLIRNTNESILQIRERLHQLLGD